MCITAVRPLLLIEGKETAALWVDLPPLFRLLPRSGAHAAVAPLYIRAPRP